MNAEDESAVKIQCAMRQAKARKALEEKKKNPSVAARNWKEVDKSGDPTLRDRLLELDRVRAKYTEQAKTIVKEKGNIMKLKLQEKKEVVRAEIETFAEKKISKGIQHAKQSAVTAAVDPFMPVRLQKWIESAISTIWPDIEEELTLTIMSLIRRPVDPVEESTSPCCLIASSRYFLFPYDKSSWKQLRSPLFILYKLITLVPVYGIPQIVYFLHLLIIDRTDEYQLITYILSFKALMFVTLGVVGMAVAAIQYYICFQEISGQDEKPICSETAPREAIFVLGLFALQVVMVWVAFWCLKTAQRKGGDLYHQRSNQNPEGLDTHRLQQEKATRDRLQFWLIYDVICFVICLALVIVCAFVGPNTQHGRVTREGWTHWRFEAALYMVKCLYGLLSFPFIFLKFPVVSVLLTHSRPTGYLPNGQCVPFKGNIEDEETLVDSENTIPDNGLWARPAAPLPK
eukprot:TRINITY_DN3506_c1_g1_i4.p1 TRINITY_DN3506_c1_g1~~TRINITY_DN3506_c1_g1_i4.p1  ORF type:complete len:473 (+),score=66.91 TRINITY_DN3506_c1_g1_i4:47-1420(+)